MSQESVTFSKETIDTMKKHYQAYLEKPLQWTVFRAKTPNATITAYQSGKVLFQGANPEIELAKWSDQTGQSHQKKDSRQQDNAYAPPDDLFTNSHIGSDESGTGDYFGPITTCAVYVQAEQIELLKEIGIQDSKALTDTKIKELATILIELKIPYSLSVLRNEKYNHLQQRGWSQGKMKAMLHDASIKSLIGKLTEETYEGILIDQFCLPPIYKKHLATEGKFLDDHTYFMTKAENYSIAVAAGSILARASFVQEMENLSAFIGTPILKGASGKVDQLIAKIIREKGESILPQIAKVHFANTNKAKKFI